MSITNNNKVVIKPDSLKKGDTIGVVAPASSFDIDNFKKGLKVLRGLGYKVKYERSIFNPCWSRPGHNRKRALQINRMFADKNIKAIFCAKAGYGSEEILSYLDKEIICNNPKIFVGYSDITAILLYLRKVANMVVFHGPVIADEFHEEMHELTLLYLKKLLTEKIPLGKLKFPQLISFKPGKASGCIVGGNLSLIVGAMGSEYCILTDDCILFLEDVREEFKVVKSYFKRLRRAGKFSNIKGLVLGKITDPVGKEHDITNIVEKMFRRYDIPILYGFPSGHTQLRGGLNVTLPFGVKGTIDADDLSLTIDESAVK